MKNICIFCGSRAGLAPDYLAATTQIGPALKARGLGMVFGGGHTGLMGAAADSALAAGVPVVGVQPHLLMARELAHPSLTELILVDTMHERKHIMAERSDAFLVLPGGIGTFEEMFEVYTWGYLGIHQKPVGIWNVAGFYDALLAFLDNCRAQGFMTEATKDLLLVDDSLDSLLDRLAAYVPPVIWPQLTEKQV